MSNVVFDENALSFFWGSLLVLYDSNIHELPQILSLYIAVPRVDCRIDPLFSWMDDVKDDMNQALVSLILVCTCL